MLIKIEHAPMRVYTYYQRFKGLGDATPIIELWRETWEQQGWETTVLNEDDAARHPRYEQYKEKVSRLPSVNGSDYEVACYLRWLAMLCEPIPAWGALLTDYDCMNISFTPASGSVQLLYRGEILLLEPTRVPCAVIATEDGYGWLCDHLENYQSDAKDLHNGKPHCSDMEILRKSNVETAAVCCEYLCSGEPIRDHLGEGWRTAPLVHFSSYSFLKLGLKGPKDVEIRKVLARLKDERS